MRPDTLNAKEAAEALGISQDKITNLLERGLVKDAYRPFKAGPWVIPNPPEVREIPWVTMSEAAVILNRSRNSIPLYRKRGWIRPIRVMVSKNKSMMVYERTEVEALAEVLRRKDAGKKESSVSWEEGQLLRHKPTKLEGKVKWISKLSDITFVYIDTDEGYRQGRAEDFERVRKKKVSVPKQKGKRHGKNR